MEDEQISRQAVAWAVVGGAALLGALLFLDGGITQRVALSPEGQTAQTNAAAGNNAECAAEFQRLEGRPPLEKQQRPTPQELKKKSCDYSGPGGTVPGMCDIGKMGGGECKGMPKGGKPMMMPMLPKLPMKMPMMKPMMMPMPMQDQCQTNPTSQECKCKNNPTDPSCEGLRDCQLFPDDPQCRALDFNAVPTGDEKAQDIVDQLSSALEQSNTQQTESDAQGGLESGTSAGNAATLAEQALAGSQSNDTLSGNQSGDTLGGGGPGNTFGDAAQSAVNAGVGVINNLSDAAAALTSNVAANVSAGAQALIDTASAMLSDLAAQFGFF